MTDEELEKECLARGWGVMTLGSSEGPVYLAPATQHVVKAAQRMFYLERRGHLDEHNELCMRVTALEQTIRDAAKLFEALTANKIVFHDTFHAWLARPEVVKARGQ